MVYIHVLVNLTAEIGQKSVVDKISILYFFVYNNLAKGKDIINLWTLRSIPAHYTPCLDILACLETEANIEQKCASLFIKGKGNVQKTALL